MYAPTHESTDDEKDDFYDQLQAAFDTCNRHDVVIIMEDLNAKVGDDNKDIEEIMGKHGLGNINDNGKRLCDFCSQEHASPNEQPIKQLECPLTEERKTKLIT